MYEVIMPKLGITMESGIIEKWHKKEGDRVEKGEVLFEVMTDKVTIEVESYNSGILKKILRAEGEEVPVTEVIAYIGEEGEKIPSHKSDQKTSERTARMETEEAVKKIDGIKEDVEISGDRVKISPLARKLALNIPEIILDVKANVTRFKTLREELNQKMLESSGVGITYTDFLLKAASNALRNNLELNSTFSDGNYIIYDDINIGLAVSSEGGLIVPTIFNCDRLKITDIAKKRIGLINKAKDSRWNNGSKIPAGISGIHRKSCRTYRLN